jgi:hypothetical protein
MSVQIKRDTNIESALAQGIELGVLRRCPRHPDVLVSIGEGPVAGLPVELTEVIEAAPRTCPRCSEEDE